MNRELVTISMEAGTFFHITKYIEKISKTKLDN